MKKEDMEKIQEVCSELSKIITEENSISSKRKRNLINIKDDLKKIIGEKVTEDSHFEKHSFKIRWEDVEKIGKIYTMLVDIIKENDSIDYKEKEALEKVKIDLEQVMGFEKLKIYNLKCLNISVEELRQEINEQCDNNINEIRQKCIEYITQSTEKCQFIEKSDLKEFSAEQINETMRCSRELMKKGVFYYSEYVDQLKNLFDARAVYKTILQEKGKTQQSIAEKISEKNDVNDPKTIQTTINKILRNYDKRTGKGGQLELWDNMICALYSDSDDKNISDDNPKEKFLKDWAILWNRQFPELSIDSCLEEVRVLYDIPQILSFTLPK